MRQIEKALGVHGLYARSVRVTNARSLRLSSPAIVHLRKDKDSRGNLGHFVVVLPDSSSTQAVVWDGLLGVRREGWGDFSKAMTGVIVLTNDSPIENVDAAIRLQSGRSVWVMCWLGGLGVGVILLLSPGLRALRRLLVGPRLPLS